MTTHPRVQVVHIAGYATVQDLGRRGFRTLGVPVSGALDRLSAVYANTLVSNRPSAAVIEVFGSIAVRTTVDAIVAVSGGYPRVFLDDVEVKPWTPFYVRGGGVVRLVPTGTGYVHYISISGGIVCEEILGSLSTYVRGSMGCLGRPLGVGDVLELGYADVMDTWDRVAETRVPQSVVSKHMELERVVTVRATEGIHSHMLRDLHILLEEEYVVSPESDRMGYRLEGKVLESAKRLGRLPSVPTDRGYVQVPPDGKPIVLMSDAQTTGGYAVALHVIPPDVDILAQTSPGRRVRFAFLGFEEAEAEVARYLKELEAPTIIREELEYWT